MKLTSNKSIFKIFIIRKSAAYSYSTLSVRIRRFDADPDPYDHFDARPDQDSTPCLGRDNRNRCQLFTDRYLLKLNSSCSANLYFNHRKPYFNKC
jgi:hypothetical protein